MDWKIPATVLILLIIVGVGALPLISPEFGETLGGYFSSFSALDDFLGGLFPDDTDYSENVIFSMTVNDFPDIKTRDEVNVVLTSDQPYTLNIDGKELKATDSVTLQDFTGEVSPLSGTITGQIDGISSDSLTLDGKMQVSAANVFLDQITIEHLKISEMTVNGGTLNTLMPQEMEAKITNSATIRGFSGELKYKNGVGQFDGTCSEIKTNGLEIGGEEVGQTLNIS